MTRRAAILFCCLVAAASAQQPPALQGAFRFVHLAWSDGETLAAASQGGTLTFDGAGAARWGEADAKYEVTAAYEARLTSGDTKLDLRFNQDAGILLGSAAGAPGSRHHLLVAVRAAEGIPMMALRGNYGIASLVIGKAETAGLATAFGQLTANGLGQFTDAVLNGHTANVDDVNRREERTGLTYEAASDGTGIAHMGAGSDVLNGDLRFALSADAAILLGWSADAANPAILLGVRKIAEAATFSFQGRFWLAEILAENSFAFQKSTRLSSAWGSLASSRTGTAYVSQRILSNGEVSYLATTNRYRIGSDGTNSLSPKLDTALNNMAFNQSAFAGAQVGNAGQLTLNHGVFFGLAAPPMLPVLTSEAAPLVPDAPVAPGALMLLSGNFPGFSGVRVNGVDARLGAVADNRIAFQAPAAFEGNAVTIEVIAAGKVTHTLNSFRAASSPAAFTAEATGVGVTAATHDDGSPILPFKPAAPGETIAFEVTGLGPAPTLRVLFDGQPGEVLSAAPIEGKAGRQRVRVTVPREVKVAAGSTTEVPLALATPDSFNDLADLLVARPAAAQQ